MDTSKKYRRFGIGALIVLGVVILIAIIVIANTLNKSPKASTEDTKQAATTVDEGKKDEKKETKKEDSKTEGSQKEDSKTESSKKEETSKELVKENSSAEATAGETKSMPTTGPEDAILPIVLIAASAYLISLNASWAKRGLRDEEKA
jgi:cytoskeletal protein RodZ